MGRAEFAVTGMTNGHCESAIRAEMPRVPGFTQVQVSSDGSAGRDRPVGGRGEGGDGRSREGRVRSSRVFVISNGLRLRTLTSRADETWPTPTSPRTAREPIKV